jgi:hypothetical protein
MEYFALDFLLYEEYLSGDGFSAKVILHMLLGMGMVRCDIQEAQEANRERVRYKRGL